VAYTYNLSTDVGKVRLLIPDNDAGNYVFDDDEIDALLGMEGGVVKRAAALGLETIASNEALTLKVLRLLDLQTDGAALARELRLQAAALRQQAAADEVASAESVAFDIAEQVYDDFGWRELALRGRL
jgi:hypothetical protein